MHQIRHFPSLHFYNDALEDGSNVLSPTYFKEFHSFPLFPPFAFFNVDSKEQRSATSHSLQNSDEAQFIARLLQKFLSQFPDQVCLRFLD